MAIHAKQMPAAEAAALIGEDDVAVFSPVCGILAATSQFDLDEPDSSRLTFLFEVGEDDLCHDGKWLDGVDYMSDLVFETPNDLAGKAYKMFGTFCGDGHATPSEDLIQTRYLFAESGGTCTVLDAPSEREAMDMGKRGRFKPNGADKASSDEKCTAAAKESPADAAHMAAMAARRCHMQMDDAATHLVRH